MLVKFMLTVLKKGRYDLTKEASLAAINSLRGNHTKAISRMKLVSFLEPCKLKCTKHIAIFNVFVCSNPKQSFPEQTVSAMKVREDNLCKAKPIGTLCSVAPK